MMKTIAKKSTKKYLPAMFGWMLSVLVLGIIIAPIAVFAQTDYTVLAPIPGTVNADGSTTNLGTYFAGFFRVAIAIAGVLAVLMIVIGGFQYATTDAIGNKQAGREKMKGALFGLLLAMSSFIILNTINPSLANIGLSNFGTLQARNWDEFLRITGTYQEKFAEATELVRNAILGNIANNDAETRSEIRSSSIAIKNMSSAYQALKRMEDLARREATLGDVEKNELENLRYMYEGFDPLSPAGQENINNIRQQLVNMAGDTGMASTDPDVPAFHAEADIISKDLDNLANVGDISYRLRSNMFIEVGQFQQQMQLNINRARDEANMYAYNFRQTYDEAISRINNYSISDKLQLQKSKMALDLYNDLKNSITLVCSVLQGESQSNCLSKIPAEPIW